MSYDPNQADDFVNKLATDDDFRKKVESDPAGAFADHGITPHADDLSGNTSLPSKEEISANINAIKNHAQSSASGAPFPFFQNQAAEGGIHYSERTTPGGIHYSDSAHVGAIRFGDRTEGGIRFADRTEGGIRFADRTDEEG